MGSLCIKVRFSQFTIGCIMFRYRIKKHIKRGVQHTTPVRTAFGESYKKGTFYVKSDGDTRDTQYIGGVFI